MNDRTCRIANDTRIKNRVDRMAFEGGEQIQDNAVPKKHQKHQHKAQRTEHISHNNEFFHRYLKTAPLGCISLYRKIHNYMEDRHQASEKYTQNS